MLRKQKEKRKGRPSFGLRALQTSCLTLCLLVAAAILVVIIWGVRNALQPVQATKIAVLSTAIVSGTQKPPGKIIFMGMSKFSNHPVALVMNPDGTNVELMDGTTRDSSGSAPRWSPDGNRIAYITSTDHLVLNVVNSNGSSNYSVDNIDNAIYPSWSPDGRHIAFQAGLDDRISKIYVVDTIGFYKGIALGLTDGAYPAWSPDGNHILFQAARNGKSTIYVMDTDGSHQIQLTTFGSEGWPAWSPDGQFIAFASAVDGNGFQLYIMKADGSNPTKITTTGQNYMPTWSPDSNHIAFYSSRNGEYEIYVIDVDGSNERKITSSGSNSEPVWIP